MLEGKTKILIPGKRGKTGVIYIPADLIKDSSFPFKPKEELQIRIFNEKLIVEKWKPDQDERK